MERYQEEAGMSWSAFMPAKSKVCRIDSDLYGLMYRYKGAKSKQKDAVDRKR